MADPEAWQFVYQRYSDFRLGAYEPLSNLVPLSSALRAVNERILSEVPRHVFVSSLISESSPRRPTCKACCSLKRGNVCITSSASCSVSGLSKDSSGPSTTPLARLSRTGEYFQILKRSVSSYSQSGSWWDMSTRVFCRSHGGYTSSENIP